jgi:hypothetical protein
LSFFSIHQEWLWFFTIIADLALAVLLFKLFGRQGLYASIIISLLLANLQGPKLTEIFGLQTSMGVILYSSIILLLVYSVNATDDEKRIGRCCLVGLS